MRMKRRSWILGLGVLLAWAAGVPGWAAPAGRIGVPGADMGFNALVTKMLRDIPEFSASVETVMTNKLDRSRVTMPMKLAKRDGALRMDIDLTAVKGAGMSLQVLNSLQSVGMAKMVNLLHRGTNTMEIFFPDLKFHTRVVLPPGELLDAEATITKKAGGRDLVNGYTCVKQVATVTSPGTKPTEVLAWEAADLKGFPVRLLIQDGQATVVMNFRDVKLTAPPEQHFAVPPGSRFFETLPALMQLASEQAMRSGGK